MLIVNKHKGQKIVAISKILTLSSFSAVNKLIGIILELLLGILLARLLGVEQYGYYIYTLTTITALATLSTIGYDTACLRFLPEYGVEKKWGLLHGFIVSALINTFFASIFVGSILFFIGLCFWNDESNITRLIVLAIPLIPLLTLSRVRQFILRSFKQIIRAEVLDIIARPLLIGGALLFLRSVFGSSPKASHAIIVNFAASLVVFLIGLFWLYKSIPHKMSFNKRSYNRHIWLRVSLPLLFISTTQLVMGYSDTIMIGLLSSYSQSGIYSAAVRISSFVGFSLLTINVILAPTISELYYSGKIVQLQSLITATTRTASGIALIICVFILLCGKLILSLYGTEFGEGFVPLILLLPGQLLNVCCGSVGLLLSLTGHQNHTALIMAVSAIINIIINYLLIPHFGMTGAAIATIISIGIWNISMVIYVQKKLNIQPTIFTFRHVNKT